MQNAIRYGGGNSTKTSNGTEECLFSMKFFLGFNLFDSLVVCIMLRARSYYFFSNVLYKNNFLKPIFVKYVT